MLSSDEAASEPEQRRLIARDSGSSRGDGSQGAKLRVVHGMEVATPQDSHHHESGDFMCSLETHHEGVPSPRGDPITHSAVKVSQVLLLSMLECGPESPSLNLRVLAPGV